MELPTAGPQEQAFFASENSPLARTTKTLWIWIGVSILIGVLISRGSLTATFISAAILLLVLLPVNIFLRRKLGSGQALVTLTAEAIESPNLSGKKKRILWHDIERVLVETVQGTSHLQFVLKPSAGLPDKKQFWTGTNLSRPTLILSTFTPEVQEQLLDAINVRLLGVAGHAPESQPASTNPLRENREFQEKLKALGPTPWMTYILIGLNVLIWLGTVALGASIAQAPADRLLAWGGNAASEVQRGEWWRLLTATFLHSGAIHVAMNMLGLYSAGLLLERIYGHRLYLVIYFSSGLIGSALSLHFSAQQAVSVGASGAVFGVTGALLVAVFQHRDKLPREFSKQMMSGVGFFVVYSLMQGFARQGIDNAAHIGGLMGGCLAAFILPERFDTERFRRTLASRAVVAVVASTLATFGIAAVAPRATLDQARIFASARFLERGISEFQSAVKAIQQEQADIQAGKLSERDADDRSRTVHAPAFRKVIEDLSQVTLRPGDRREPIVRDTIRASELLAESLAMESVFIAGDPKPRPADPVRSAQIEAELNVVAERLKKNSGELNKKR
ncbi:MAG: rhomboid family intramembrane serine protease [Rhodocyclales bacterium]|nr:rhomboid family intramembrane serine protease [Rhodocyclales bacterium]